MIIKGSNKLNYPVIAILVYACLFLSSCISNKRITYIQKKTEGVAYSDTVHFYRNFYKLQVNDVVNIEVKTRNEEFAKYFVSNSVGGSNTSAIGAQSGGDLFYTIGYSISDSGTINFPLIGKVHIEGLLLREIEEKIEAELRTMQIDVTAIVRMGGIKITLLGEFYRPGKFVALQNQLTIFEAIALGGDLKEIANRNKVTLIRQYPDGVRIHYLDVLDQNIISSPYFFLQPNDLIYVEPLKRRAYGVGVNGLQTLSTALSVITTTLLLINYFNK
jgi:polysaccharide biosynthesis/export protein